MTKNQSNNNITRATTRAWAEIDLSAIRDNFAVARDHAKKYGAETFAIMKANAYGHGAAVVAKELETAGAKHFAAATLDEALERTLRGFRVDTRAERGTPVAVR